MSWRCLARWWRACLESEGWWLRSHPRGWSGWLCPGGGSHREKGSLRMQLSYCGSSACLWRWVGVYCGTATRSETKDRVLFLGLVRKCVGRTGFRMTGRFPMSYVWWCLNLPLKFPQGSRSPREVPRIRRGRHWHWIRRIASRTGDIVSRMWRNKRLVVDLGALPNLARVLGILFDNGQNTGRDDTMGFAEIVIDFFPHQ